MPGEIGSINNYEELRNATPDTVRFHSTFKATARMLLRWVKFPDRWVQDLRGNAKILWEIFLEYRNHERQEHRKTLLVVAIPLIIFCYFFDSNFREVGNYFLYKVFQRRDEFVFPPHHLDPSTWGRDGPEPGLNRQIQGANIPPDRILVMTEIGVALRDRLPPKVYVLRIGEEYFGINSNQGAEITGGWAYPIAIRYGTEEKYRHNVLFGDP